MENKFYINWDKFNHYRQETYCNSVFYNDGYETFYDEFMKWENKRYTLPIEDRDIAVYQFMEDDGDVKFIAFLFENTKYNVVVFNNIPVDNNYLRIFTDIIIQSKGNQPLKPETKLHMVYSKWEEFVREKSNEDKTNNQLDFAELINQIRNPFENEEEEAQYFKQIIRKYYKREEYIRSEGHEDLTENQYNKILSMLDILNI